jgi:lipoyl(octanoyl) transferase
MGFQAPDWRIETGLVPYEAAVAEMEARVAAIRSGTAPELVWLLEHPPLYTAGTSARRGGDIRRYVHDLEEWLIRTLQRFDVRGERREGRVGIWVTGPSGSEEKIAAIGVRVRHWVTFHGAALNVDPDLSHYSGIVPCGIADRGVTSLAALGVTASMAEVDDALRSAFAEVFAPAIVGERETTGSTP